MKNEHEEGTPTPPELLNLDEAPTGTPHTRVFNPNNRESYLPPEIIRRAKAGFPEFEDDEMQSEADLYHRRVSWMNDLFELESNLVPTDLGVVRLLKFYKTILNEVEELLECVNDEEFAHHILDSDPTLTASDDPNYIEDLVAAYERDTNCKLEVNMTALADTLGDLNVYDTSEFLRWGFPMMTILNTIMESQASKLDENGKPLKSEDGAKFIKGPYFESPEAKIREILDSYKE